MEYMISAPYFCHKPFQYVPIVISRHVTMQQK